MKPLAPDFDPDTASPAELQHACWHLLDEVLLLREALGVTKAALLQEAFGLTCSASRILAQLACGRLCTFNQIAAGLAFDDPSRDVNRATIRTHVYQLRRDLGARPIRIGTVPCTGYQIAEGRGLVLEAMNMPAAVAPRTVAMTGWIA